MHSKRVGKLNIIIFPLLVLLLTAFIYSDNRQVLANPDSSIYDYINNLQDGNIGYGSESRSQGNRISFDELEIGDIVLGGYPDCAYGRFSHAAIYIGNGNVMEGFLDTGITNQSIKHFWNYSEIALLRVEAAEEIKSAAAEYAQMYEGDIFFPLAFKPGDRIWNCTKIIWKAYIEQGIDLDSVEDIWIAPDSFYNSSYVTVIDERGNNK